MKQEGRVVGVFGDAFRLRPGESYLSTTWLEYFDGTQRERLERVVLALRNMPREVKKKDGLVILNVGNVENCGAPRSITLKCWHEPKAENRAYAAIRGLPRDDTEVAELIAEVAAEHIVVAGELKE